MNTYGYVGGNPLSYADPYGLCPAGGLICVPAGIGIGIGARALINYITRASTLGIAAWGAANSGDDESSCGAKDAPESTTDNDLDEWIYGPKNDPKINPDGSTTGDTWTTPDDYGSSGEAQDKLDPFKPFDGRRKVNIPKGTTVKKGNTPGGEGPFNGSGGGNETLIPGGLPPGSVGPWESF